MTGKTESWWLKSLAAAVAAMVWLLLILIIPFGLATVILIFGAAIFLLVLFRNPEYWARRVAGGLVGLAAMSFLLPRISVRVVYEPYGEFVLNTASNAPPWLLIGGLAFGVIDYLMNSRPGRSRDTHPSTVGRDNVTIGDNASNVVVNLSSANDPPTLVHSTRASLRGVIEPLLHQNRHIHKEYGPDNDYRFNPESEKAVLWRVKVVENIIPNNNRILELLDANRELLDTNELQTLEEFRLHAHDLACRHTSDSDGVGGRYFPTQMNKILL